MSVGTSSPRPRYRLHAATIEILNGGLTHAGSPARDGAVAEGVTRLTDECGSCDTDGCTCEETQYMTCTCLGGCSVAI